MKKTLVLVSLVSLIASMSAFADCRQANLESSDGSQIAVGYSSFYETNGNTAWINPAIHVVLSADKCSAQEVVVQLVQTQFGFSSSRPLTLVKEDRNPCAFSGSLENVLLANHGGSPAQQIAVQVVYKDGGSEWLVDPVSQSHNFNYAFETTGYSPNVEVCQ